MKYCSHCGQEILNEAVVCPHCGCPVHGGNMPSRPRPLDILSLVGFILSFVVAVAGLAVSIIAYSRIKYTDDNTSKGFAKAGIIISSVEIGIEVIAVVLCVVLALGFGLTLSGIAMQ